MLTQWKRWEKNKWVCFQFLQVGCLSWMISPMIFPELSRKVRNCGIVLTHQVNELLEAQKASLLISFENEEQQTVEVLTAHITKVNCMLQILSVLDV